jgi:hypothetical protein
MCRAISRRAALFPALLGPTSTSTPSAGTSSFVPSLNVIDWTANWTVRSSIPGQLREEHDAATAYMPSRSTLRRSGIGRSLLPAGVWLSARALRRRTATSAGGGAGRDGVGLLTPALLLCQERGHPARAAAGFWSGRAPVARSLIGRTLLTPENPEADRWPAAADRDPANGLYGRATPRLPTRCAAHGPADRCDRSGGLSPTPRDLAGSARRRCLIGI